MNVAHSSLPDVQSGADNRNLAIDAVGVKRVRYPITVKTAGGEDLPTVATFELSVSLGHSARALHMSRFIEVLESVRGSLDHARFRGLASYMLDRLHARAGALDMRFPYFVRKTAPASGASSLLDYEVGWRAEFSVEGDYSFAIDVVVPVTSLCPCSKVISAYGAHNQRSAITIRAELLAPMSAEELIAIAERCASCELYGLLKRPDEKYVTERAYENPKFVEDLVRDVALALRSEPSIGAFVVESENFESIHNHSAFARIDRPGRETATSPSGMSICWRGERDAAA